MICTEHPGRENHCVSGQCGACWLCLDERELLMRERALRYCSACTAFGVGCSAHGGTHADPDALAGTEPDDIEQHLPRYAGMPIWPGVHAGCEVADKHTHTPTGVCTYVGVSTTPPRGYINPPRDGVLHPEGGVQYTLGGGSNTPYGGVTTTPRGGSTPTQGGVHTHAGVCPWGRCPSPEVVHGLAVAAVYGMSGQAWDTVPTHLQQQLLRWIDTLHTYHHVSTGPSPRP